MSAVSNASRIVSSASGNVVLTGWKENLAFVVSVCPR